MTSSTVSGGIASDTLQTYVGITEVTKRSVFSSIGRWISSIRNISHSSLKPGSNIPFKVNGGLLGCHQRRYGIVSEPITLKVNGGLLGCHQRRYNFTSNTAANTLSASIVTSINTSWPDLLDSSPLASNSNLNPSVDYGIPHIQTGTGDLYTIVQKHNRQEPTSERNVMPNSIQPTPNNMPINQAVSNPWRIKQRCFGSKRC